MMEIEEDDEEELKASKLRVDQVEPVEPREQI